MQTLNVTYSVASNRPDWRLTKERRTREGEGTDGCPVVVADVHCLLYRISPQGLE